MLNRVRIGSGIVAVIGIGIAFLFMFQAGCAGDAKTGLLGNPMRALAIERYALPPFFIGLVAATAFVALGFAPSRNQRIANALTLLIIGGGFLWWIGIQLEDWGIHSCFDKH